MTDRIIKNDYESNFSYPAPNGPMNPTMTNMSVVPQISTTRPSTLSINGQREHNPSLFTPNDFKYSLSTPDLINALASQPFSDGQPSPGPKMLDELFAVHQHSNAFNPNIYQHISTIDHLKHENVPSYNIIHKRSQISSSDRSVSSSINENESSDSTEPSSPTATYSHLNSVKDELQHVPSIHTKYPGEPQETVKKEKKRERNRQAAQKCRTRKLNRIAELQKRVNDLQGKNKDLTGLAEFLKSDITKLEKQLQDHHTQGCTLMSGSIL